MFDIYEWIKKMKCEIEPAHEDLFRYIACHAASSRHTVVNHFRDIVRKTKIWFVIKFMPDFSRD